MKTRTLVAFAVGLLALGACSVGPVEADVAAPSEAATPDVPTPTLSEREVAEAAFVEFIRGPLLDAGEVDVSSFTDAQAIAQGDAMCQRITDVIAGGGEASIDGVVLLEYIDTHMGDGSVDTALDEDLVYMDQVTGLTLAATRTLCPEHQEIP